MTTTYVPGDLVQAAKSRDIQGASDLLKLGADPNEKDEDGETPLIWAACYGLTGLVSLLIEKGAVVDGQETGTGRTALIYVVRSANIINMRGCEHLLGLLIENGASLDIRDKDGLTALDWAKKENKPGIEKILQEAMDQQRLIAAEKTAREAAHARIATLHNTAATRQAALKKHAPKLTIPR